MKLIGFTEMHGKFCSHSYDYDASKETVYVRVMCAEFQSTTQELFRRKERTFPEEETWLKINMLLV